MSQIPVRGQRFPFVDMTGILIFLSKIHTVPELIGIGTAKVQVLAAVMRMHRD